MIYVTIFIFGSIIGSFLNVCIYRIPRKKSIIFPGSKCVYCNRSIPWYDNIPLLSYILLKGKCRYCNKRISFRYLAVEFISTITFLVIFINFGFTEKYWIYSAVTFGLIVVSFIDLEFQIIPDRITVLGILLGIVMSSLLPGLHQELTWQAGLIKSIFGAAVGGGIIYLTGFLGELAFKKESMGGGDVKLMAMLGAFLGWEKVLLVFFMAPFFGTPVGLYLKFRKKAEVIPYGPYISMASFVVMLFGDKILSALFL